MSDGFGKRYFLGPFYLILGDIQGAIESYEWFEREFSDDVGEPGQCLCWVLAHYRSGDKVAAAQRLLKADLENLYMFPALFGWEPKKHEMWHGSNWQWIEYLEEIPREYFALWKTVELNWAMGVYQSPTMQELRKRHIEIREALKGEKDREKRRLLIEEDSRLRSTVLPASAEAQG